MPDAVLTDDEAISSPEGFVGDAADQPIGTASERLFRALSAEENGSDVDKLVSAVMTEVNADCPAVEAYQNFVRSGSFMSLKIKCVDRALYAVTVGPNGIGVISGGDGSVERMNAEQGEIRTLSGNAPATTAPIRRPSPISLQTLAIIAGVLVLLVIAVRLYWTRRAKIVAPWRGLRSEEKDRILEEADEIWPDVFHHPSGIWIARGRRGKRRLFRNQIFALAYARHGMKLFQVR
jgi:hypothetical protein|tara:strand:+ start:18176 stop:18880 length:705 start_codon:yes stop_codon:yes gene_type:complete